MMQTIIVIAVVVLAAAALAWRVWRKVRGRSCGCEHCPSSQPPKP